MWHVPLNCLLVIFTQDLLLFLFFVVNFIISCSFSVFLSIVKLSPSVSFKTSILAKSDDINIHTHRTLSILFYLNNKLVILRMDKQMSSSGKKALFPFKWTTTTETKRCVHRVFTVHIQSLLMCQQKSVNSGYSVRCYSLSDSFLLFNPW